MRTSGGAGGGNLATQNRMIFMTEEEFLERLMTKFTLIRVKCKSYLKDNFNDSIKNEIVYDIHEEARDSCELIMDYLQTLA